MSLDRLNTIKRILDDQNTLGARADTKAVALLTSLGLFAAFFIYFIKDIVVNPFTISMLTIYFLSAVLAMYNIIMTINPRVRTNGNTAGKKGHDPHQTVFYADICRFNNAGEYKDCLQEMLKDEQVVEDVYTRQIYEVSQVTAAKYRYAHRSVYFVLAAICAEFILVAYVFAEKALS
jgi:hypothetical protein